MLYPPWVVHLDLRWSVVTSSHQVDLKRAAGRDPSPVPSLPYATWCSYKLRAGQTKDTWSSWNHRSDRSRRNRRIAHVTFAKPDAHQPHSPTLRDPSVEWSVAMLRPEMMGDESVARRKSMKLANVGRKR